MNKGKPSSGLEFEPDMPKDALQRLRDVGIRRTYSANRMVITIGDDFPDLFLIETGKFSISVIDETGNSWIYGYLGAGSTWGLKAALTEKPADFFFETLEESTVYCIDKNTLWSLIDRDPIVRRGVILSLGWSISKATAFAHKERSLPLRIRLINFLVENADGHGVLKLTQADTARVLGVSRYALGTHLQKLKRHKLIEISYGQVRVLDLHGLTQASISS